MAIPEATRSRSMAESSVTSSTVRTPEGLKEQEDARTRGAGAGTGRRRLTDPVVHKIGNLLLYSVADASIPYGHCFITEKYIN